ncbi:MAG: insulinase family protein [Deltaproteobacteria bacterium]|nr:insulinase family protein [Deltaproteobacteria bacterium]
METLANGLKLIEINQPGLHTVNISVFVKTGSRFESRQENGISHFLEHMIFRGTSAHPTAFELNQAFERLGANVNGSTTPDSTEYSITLPSQSVITASSLLFEMITQPHFNEIDTERKIIIEEILEDFDEELRCVDIDTMSRQRIWYGNGLGASITGSIENVTAFDYDDVIRWYDTNYVAQNMIVCVSGNISDESLKSNLRSSWCSLKPGSRQTITPYVPLHKTAPTYPYLHIHKPGSQTQLRLAFLTPGLLDANYPVIEILLRLIDDGMSTPLHRRIFENLALAYNIGAELEAYEDTGVLNIDAQASHENISSIAGESLRIVAEVKDGLFTDDDLIKAKNRAIWDLESLSDFPGALNSWYGEQELYRPSRTPAQLTDRIIEITKDDVARMAASLFHPGNLIVTTVGTQSGRQQQQLEKALAMFGWRKTDGKGNK